MVNARHSWGDVSHVGKGVRGRPAAVLLQDVLVGFGVEIGPPQQHLTDEGTGTGTGSHMGLLTGGTRESTPTWLSAPPEANRSPAREKTTVSTAPWNMDSYMYRFDLCSAQRWRQTFFYFRCI